MCQTGCKWSHCGRKGNWIVKIRKSFSQVNVYIRIACYMRKICFFHFQLSEAMQLIANIRTPSINADQCQSKLWHWFQRHWEAFRINAMLSISIDRGSFGICLHEWSSHNASKLHFNDPLGRQQLHTKCPSVSLCAFVCLSERPLYFCLHDVYKACYGDNHE